MTPQSRQCTGGMAQPRMPKACCCPCAPPLPSPALQATGLQAKWDRVKGLPQSLGDGHVVSNMNVRTAPLTFKAVQGLKQGNALFTMPKGVIKCPGAGQKVSLNGTSVTGSAAS